MLNGFFVLCCFCRMHWEFTPFCNSMNTVATATWFMFFPEGHWWKKASLILQFRPESNAEIPITSLKSLGRINSHLSQDFPIPAPDKTRKNWLTRPYMRMSSNSKPPHFPTNSSVQTTSGNFFRFLKKHSRIKTTKQWHSHTKKAHNNPNKTKQKKQIQTKQISEQNNPKQNITPTPSKQNSKHKKQQTHKKDLKATSSKHTEKKKQATKPQAFSVFEFISLSFRESPRLGGCASPKPIACRAIFVACNPSICGRHVKLVVQRPRPR